MVPEDLNCLSSCFKKYQKNQLLLAQIQRQCSKIGFDRQIPTHMSEGLELVKSNFTLIIPQFPLPFNPSLDCLVYFESVERKECSTDEGVCNYIPDQTGSNKGSKQVIHRLDPTINTTITKVKKDYKKKYLRASNPVTRAIAVCALAELIQFHKVQKYPDSGIFLGQSDLFSRDSSSCDHFMPDIFVNLCSCAGSCAPEHFDPTREKDSPSNLILHFLTNDGLWGCQDACRNTENCEFYTHSKVNYFGTTQYAETPAFPVFQCFLWKSCAIFTIPIQGIYPYTDQSISDHWSGPRDCTLYKQKCPVVSSKSEAILSPLPDGYYTTKCLEDSPSSPETIEELCSVCVARGDLCGFKVRSNPCQSSHL